jgi:hypothetical protein
VQLNISIIVALFVLQALALQVSAASQHRISLKKTKITSHKQPQQKKTSKSQNLHQCYRIDIATNEKSSVQKLRHKKKSSRRAFDHLREIGTLLRRQRRGQLVADDKRKKKKSKIMSTMTMMIIHACIDSMRCHRSRLRRACALAAARCCAGCGSSRPTCPIDVRSIFGCCLLLFDVD